MQSSLPFIVSAVSCEYGHCIALVKPGLRYCPIHEPNAIIDRVREIIHQHCSKQPALHEAIVRDLEQTV